MWKNSSTQFGSVAKFFHWIIFLLLFCMIIFGYFLDDIPKDYQATAFNLHKLTGLTILLLMLLRMFWAFINERPALPMGTSLTAKILERVMQVVLYLVVFAMPMVGWIGSCAKGRPPHLGSVDLNLPVPLDKSLGHAMFEMHSLLAITLIVLVSLHALAALYHHFVLKDDVLKRMLPH